jgi:hypothetical protein
MNHATAQVDVHPPARVTRLVIGVDQVAAVSAAVLGV